jgi:hypothetical protein
MLTNEGPDRETAALRRQHQDVTTRILAAMSRRDREALMRFYLDRQSEEQIEADLGLTEKQFRLIKSRARAQYDNVCLQRIAAYTPAEDAGSRTSASCQPHRQRLGSRSHYGKGLSSSCSYRFNAASRIAATKSSALWTALLQSAQVFRCAAERVRSRVG